MQLCFLVSICKLVIGAQIIDEYSDIRSLRHVNIRSLKTSIRCSPSENPTAGYEREHLLGVCPRLQKGDAGHDGQVC